MKLACQTSDLLKSASLAQRATKSKTTLMALSHLLVEPNETSVKITGTDLEVSLSRECPADVSRPEPFLVPAELFVGLLKNTGAETCAIETAPSKVKITLDMAESTISTLDAAEFPELQEPSSEPIVFDSKVLSKALKLAACNTMEASSINDDKRAGVHFLGRDGKFHITSANYKSLATISFDSPAKTDAVLTRKFTDLLTLISNDDEGQASIEIDEKTAVARLKNCSLTGKLREGGFVPWWEFIPKNQGKKFSVNREALISALRTASMFSLENFYGVLFDVNGEVKISTRAPLNQHSETLAIEKLTEFDSVKMAMCHEGLLSILPKLSGDSVILEIDEEKRPVMIQEDNFRYVTATLQNL